MTQVTLTSPQPASPLCLCLDAGNTRLKWGMFDGVTWLGRGVVAYADLDAWLADLPPELAQAVARQAITQISISNVAGAAVAAQLQNALSRQPLMSALPLHFLRTSVAACGVKNGYAEPLRLGVDRWCALVGAWVGQQQPCLVVSAGTATTIDSLDAAGNFLGGFILPGVTMMQTALARGTAQLPLASLNSGEHQFYPNNTHDAIRSGALEATAGAIVRAQQRLQQRYPDTQIFCQLTGGASPLLLPLLADFPLQHQPELVLRGAYYLGLLTP